MGCKIVQKQWCDMKLWFAIALNTTVVTVSVEGGPLGGLSDITLVIVE